jgi:hypothetical protein
LIYAHLVIKSFSGVGAWVGGAAIPRMLTF